MSENRVKVWCATDLSDAEMLKGAYLRHSYPWHTHEDLCLGLVLGGAINLRTRARSGLAAAGSFVLINTDEVHQGSPVNGAGWQCRTIHVHPNTIQQVADEHRAFRKTSPIMFKGPTLNDAVLAARLVDLHRHSEAGGSSLERQSLMVGLISCLLERYAEQAITPSDHDSEPRAITRARGFLDENLSDKVTLDDLAVVAELTPFRLLRAFRKAIGLTPHEYQLQARVRQAHARLRRREQLADIAVAVGFSDQAHLTRVFKRMMGATPGQFRAASPPTPASRSSTM